MAPDQPPRLRYWARYVASDPTHDLAIIKIEQLADESPVPAGTTFTAMPVGNSNDLIPGDTITVVGYPGVSGSTITFTAGLMSGWLGEDLEAGGKQWIKTDAKIARGNSGGAAFNQDGHLIGVPTAGYHLLEGSLYEEQLYVRPIGLAWSLIGPHVPNVVRAPGTNPTPVHTQTDPAPQPPVTPTTAGGSGDYGTMALGETREGTFAAVPENESFIHHTYTVNVPEGVTELVVSASGGDKDIDLAVNAGAEITDYEQADHVDITEGTDPSYTYTNPPAGPLYINVISFLAESAPYTLTVQASTPTTTPTPTPTPTPAPTNPLSNTTVTAPTQDSTMVGALQIGQTATGQLRGTEGAASYHTYYVDVPAGTASLVISMSANQDLDLAAKFGSEIASYGEQSEAGDWTYQDKSESNSAEFTIENPLAGRWYIDVFSYHGPSVVGKYTLTVR
jgi:hypothetical protein